MQSLGRVLAADDDRSVWSDFWYGDPGRAGSSTRVSADTVMGIPAVYACTTIISEDISKLPLQMFEDLGTEGRRRAGNHPLDDVIDDEPNPHQTGIEFKEMMQAFALLRKFGIAEIKPGRRGVVDTLWPLHPDLVREERIKSSGAPRYIYRDPRRDFAERTLLADEVFVVRGKLGRSILDFARDSFGLELAMDQYQGFLFSRGVKAQGVVSYPKGILPDPLRRAIRKGLSEYAAGGPRAGQPLLLEDGMTWESVSINPRDAQYEQIRNASLRQVCRWFRMPPAKIADINDYHYATIESENIHYVTDTLLGHTIRWEQAIKRDLIVNKDRFYARFNLDAMLRGSTQDRYQAYEIAVRMRWMSRNEVRAKENMNPVAGGDEFDEFPASGGSPVQVKDLSPTAHGHLKLIASGVAERLVRREYAAINKLAARTDGQAFREGVETFYGEHADDVARDLAIPKPLALRYAREQRTSLLADGPVIMETWLEERVKDLTDMAMETKELAA